MLDNEHQRSMQASYLLLCSGSRIQQLRAQTVELVLSLSQALACAPLLLLHTGTLAGQHCPQMLDLRLQGLARFHVANLHPHLRLLALAWPQASRACWWCCHCTCCNKMGMQTSTFEHDWSSSAARLAVPHLTNQLVQVSLQY